MIKTRQFGFVLPSVLITTVFLTLIGAIVTQLAVNNYGLANKDLFRLNAQLAADAGLERGITELNVDNDWAGTGGETELLNENNLKVTYEVTIIAGGSGDVKTIRSIGRSYKPADSTEPQVSREYSTLLRGVGGGSGGSYSIVTGVGGLFMENSSKIVDGEVYVNGEIYMQNTSQIGTTTNSVTVKAAHANCPAGGGSGYPRVCNSGENGEPIVIDHPAWIYGEVKGTNQTTGTRMSNPGLVPNQTVPVLELPEHDREQQKTNVEETRDSSWADCDSNSAVRTWPKNLKITGDVKIEKKCKIYLTGDVWIQGKLEIINSAQFIVSDTLVGSDTVDGELPSVMVDGSNGVMLDNSAQSVANSSGVGIQFVTYHSAAGCSPDCADVTDSDLYNSREIVTILMRNSASAPESVFYARWTQAQLDNGGDIGAVIGQTVRLMNSAVVTFGQPVAGGGGGSSIWTYLIDQYKRTNP